ncbi:MAG: hypothetical protein WCS42_13620, partial [Verrucomicrobiota bacterium]
WTAILQTCLNRMAIRGRIAVLFLIVATTRNSFSAVVLLIQENGFQFRNSSRQPFPMTGCKMMKSKSPSRNYLIRTAAKNPSRLVWNNCMAKVPHGNCRNLALESSVALELDRPQSNVLPVPVSASL